MNENFIITIGRQFGSGGREIGRQLSRLMNINYYDKELIQEAAKESGMTRIISKKQMKRHRRVSTTPC